MFETEIVFTEYLVWLVVFCVGWTILHYWAFYLVFLWTVYFFATRLLEQIQIGDLQKKAILISGCDSGFGHDLAIKCIQNGMPVFAGCLTENVCVIGHIISDLFRVF
jgi:hypothetical protein